MTSFTRITFVCIFRQSLAFFVGLNVVGLGNRLRLQQWRLIICFSCV